MTIMMMKMKKMNNRVKEVHLVIVIESFRLINLNYNLNMSHYQQPKAVIRKNLDRPPSNTSKIVRN
jgi:hypothetical protein